MSATRTEQNKKENRDLLKRLSQEARTNGINAAALRVPHVNATVLSGKRLQTRQLRAYFSQMYAPLEKLSTGLHHAYAVFDEDGCIVQMRGNADFLKKLSLSGISPGADFSSSASGANAVCASLSVIRPVSSCGKEHTLRALHPFAFHFAPIRINTTALVKLYGGIALIVPAEESTDDLLAHLMEVAIGLTIHLQSSIHLTEAYQTESRGQALLTINYHTNEVFLNHQNRSFLRMLQIKTEPGGLYFTPLAEYIRPLPDNKRFWKLVLSDKAANNVSLRLQLQNAQPLSCIVSSKPGTDYGLETREVFLILDTRSRIIQEISGRTANSAVITFDRIIGTSAVMQLTLRKARILAETESNVMLIGESGTGKDIFAQAIHNASSRRNGPFVALNCGALPRDLIESELFGYEGGAFTGAKRQGNVGKFELANGGTLFLDEIGEMPLDLQATLLRAVEQKQFMRLGSGEVTHVDIRIISATNADIPRMIEEKKFRMDLYYRLATMFLRIPPLRDRQGDVLLLAEHFISSFTDRMMLPETKVLSAEAKETLVSLPFYGNVRELQNLMECVVQLSEYTEITARDILDNASPVYDIPALTSFRPSAYPSPERPIQGAASASGKHPRKSLREEDIKRAIEACGGNRTEAARYLGIARKTLYRNMERLGMN